MQGMLGTRGVGCGPSSSSCVAEPLHVRCHQRHRLVQHRVPARCHAVSTATPAPTVAGFPATQPGLFGPDNKSFSEEHRVRGAEVAYDQRATMITIANLLQECAGNHAVGMWGRADAGFANIPNLKDLVFVMTRLQIRMYEYPKWGDLVRVETFFAEDGSLRARRDWHLWDAESGKLLGVATSSWVTINMATRRISKIPEDMRSYFMAFSAPEGRCSLLPAEETRKKIPDVLMPDDYAGPNLFARRSDMDMNGHVNNVVYIAWVLETVPQEIYNNFQLREIEVDFKQECVAGVAVQSVCNKIETSLNGTAPTQQFLHALFKGQGPKSELVRARSTYVRL